MKRASLLMGLVLLVLCARAFAAEDQPLLVNDVRYWSGGEYTRVVIDLSGDTHFAVNRLEGPDRIYFDFSACKLVKASGQTISIEDRHVGAVRTGQYDPRTVRVVVDLKDNIGFKVFRLTGPSRVVVDIYKREREEALAFASTSSSPEPAASLVPTEQQKQAPVMTAQPPEPQHMSPEALSKVLAEASARNPAKTPEPSSSKPSTEQAPIVQTAKAEPPAVPSAPASNQEPPSKPSQTDKQPRIIKGTVPPPLKRIVIDPGHGGKDPGAVGLGGIKEKDIVLDVARRLKRELEARGGYDVMLTRSRDEYLDLEERSILANQRDADLFVSVHVNANRNPSVRGIETYVLKWSDEKSSQEVAERENMVSARRMKQGRDDVGVMLASLALAHKSEQSAHLATKVQDAMEGAAAREFSPAPSNKAKGAMFYVLYGARMPSILVELAYVTNREDSSRLRNTKFRKLMAEGIADGIDSYFKEPMPHLRVAMR